MEVTTARHEQGGQTALDVTVVGCSGSVPGPHSAGSCYLVQAAVGGRTWSIVPDLGNGALGSLQRYVHPMELDAVLLSHLHADHCIDLTGLYVWARYGPQPAGKPARSRLPVYGPEGTADRLARASEAQPVAQEVEADGGLDAVFDFHVLADGCPFAVGPLQITPIAVRHPVPTFGFRVQIGAGPVLAYTGDTDSCPALTPLMTDAALVLADCAYVDGRDDQQGVHLSGSRAGAATAQAGGVGELVLTHLTPWTDPEVCLQQAARTWAGPLSIARPGSRYLLHPG